MYNCFSKDSVATRILLGVLLIALLTGCGSSAAPTSSPSTNVSPTSPTGNTSAPTPVPTQDTSAPSTNQDKDFDSPPLHIKADGFKCPVDSFPGLGWLSHPIGNPVLAGDSSADVGQINQLVASIDQDDPSLVPNGFGLVPGAFVSPKWLGSCDSLWEFTNTSQDIVQITQIALRYTANPQINSYHYKLINICSLPIQKKSSLCVGGRGGHSDTQVYEFKVGMQSTGTVITDQQAATLTLNPNDTVKVDLSVVPSDTSNPNYIYSLVPQLSLNTSSGQSTFDVPQMSNTIAFTDINHASCYQLQADNTFKQISSFSDEAYNMDAAGNWFDCV